MEDGPYSGEGFLQGWNVGNRFSIRAALSSNPEGSIPSLPTDTLRAAWVWNYNRVERSERLSNRCFVPIIVFFIVEGRLSRVAIWPLGGPVLLLSVDYVLVGRIVSDEKRFGLAAWSEVLEIVRSASFDTEQDPLDLEYFVTPPPIAQWVANIPSIDRGALTHLTARQILDDEMVADARNTIAQGKIDS